MFKFQARFLKLSQNTCNVIFKNKDKSYCFKLANVNWFQKYYLEKQKIKMVGTIVAFSECDGLKKEHKRAPVHWSFNYLDFRLYFALTCVSILELISTLFFVKSIDIEWLFFNALTLMICF